MRISDWSSDVCTAHLFEPDQLEEVDRGVGIRHADHRVEIFGHGAILGAKAAPFKCFEQRYEFIGDRRRRAARFADMDVHQQPARAQILAPLARSEEHTSELPYLMRPSYA